MNPQEPQSLPRLSVRRWLTGPLRLVTVLAVLLPIAFLGVYSLRLAEKTLRRSIEADNRSTAALTAETLQAYLTGDAAVARTVAVFPGMMDAVRRRDEAAVRERLRRITELNPLIDRAIMLDSEGVEWSDWPFSAAALGKNFSHRDYFQGVMRTGEAYVSEVFMRTAEPRVLVVAVAVPVRLEGPATAVGSGAAGRRGGEGARGHIDAVLVFQHRAAAVTSWLRRTVREGGVVGVTDDAGNSGKTIIVLDRNGAVAGHSATEISNELEGRYAALPQVRSAMRGSWTGQAVEYTDPVSRRAMIASFQPLQVSKDTRWLVISQQDRDMAYQSIGRLRRQMLLAASAVALLALGATWILGQANERNRRMGLDLTTANRQLQKALDEQEKARQELAEERRLFHTLMDHLPDRIYFKDEGSRFTRVNKAMADLFKAASPAAVVGKTDFDVFSHEHAQPAFEDEQQVMSSNTPIIGKVEQEILPDGRIFWVSSTKFPLHDEAGNVVGTFGISRDVTLLKQMEDDLLQANLEAGERNAQLQQANAEKDRTNQALKEAQGQLVQSAKLAGLGQMVAGVAHEINNPLSFVSNNAAVLQRDIAALRKLLEFYRQADPLLESAQPELMARIRGLADEVDLDYVLSNLDDLLVRSRDGLRRIAQIVKDLRDFARTEDAEMHECDLNSGIESTVGIVRGRARKNQVQLELQLGKLPPVTCNPGKINQVIMNLVANAIDACPQGGGGGGGGERGGKVLVRTACAGDDITIEVLDNGKGISPADREHLFEPFFTTKPQGEGVGLGLCISYGIVQSHGGTIEVESTPGAGTRFIVRLPRHPRPAPHGEVASRAASPGVGSE